MRLIRSLCLALVIVTPAAAQTLETSAGKVVVETVATGLQNPWALTFLDDGRMLVTEKAGRLRLVRQDGSLSPPLAGLPAIWQRGQGGLLDAAPAPDFATSRTLYVTFAEARDGGGATSLLRAQLNADATALEGARVIFRQQPASGGPTHFGSRIVFGRDGMLYLGLGERGQREKSQDLSTHYGKVVRLRPDGSVPPDNPFVGWAGALPEIFSYGHRNIQGAALNPRTGALWTVEHGARGGDEINIPRPGRNYGWPVITYGMDYSGAKIGEGTHREGMEQPIHYWDPSIAPSGMLFYTGDRFPAWRGSLFVGALAGSLVSRLTLDGDRITGEERLLRGLGHRFRDIRQGPDGLIYLLVDSGSGRVLRLRPQ